MGRREAQRRQSRASTPVPALGRLIAIRRLCVLKRKNRGNQKEKHAWGLFRSGEPLAGDLEVPLGVEEVELTAHHTSEHQPSQGFEEHESRNL
jgi:hypothetical protein